MSDSPKLTLITGATGHTGQFLLPKLFNAGGENKIRCLVRNNSDNLSRINIPNIEIAYGDMEDEDSLRKAFDGANTVIHLVNVRYSLTVARLAEETGVERIILIHTTGMYSKFRKYAQEYLDIEKDIFRFCKVNFVILRPSMIYGSIYDHNMHKLITYIKNKSIFPVFGDGENLMQPVHAKDLAEAIVRVSNNTRISNKAYDISGGTVLKYKEILECIAAKVNPDIKFIYIPYSLSLMLGYMYSGALSMLGRKGRISIEQIKRLNENKNYSHAEATADFGYQPVPFEEGIEEEIRSMGL